MVDRWAVIKEYRRLIRAGSVAEFTCDHCGGPAFARADDTVNPFFECWACEVTFRPGLEFYRTLQQIIDIHRSK